MVAYLQRMGTDVKTAQTPRDPASNNDAAPRPPDSLDVGTSRPAATGLPATPDGTRN